MKLKNLKTTIISSVGFGIALFGAMPVFANTNNGVTLINNAYLIETKVVSISRVRDNRIAPLKAKAQLYAYLKTQYPLTEIRLKHFTLLSKRKTENSVIYTFKVEKENVVMVCGRLKCTK